MYVAVKGGEAAIAAAHELLARERRGDTRVPEITTDQIREQLTLAVNRVMCEGSLYDPDLAALAIKQARGDLIEAIFLLRAYRTTLPRLGYAEPMDTEPNGDPPPHLGDLQGPAGRPGAGADLRLHPPPARSRLWPAAPSLSSCPQRRRRSVPEQAGAARDRTARPGGPDRAERRERECTSPWATSPATRWRFRPTATRACRRWPAATRASCWRSATPRSAAMAARTPSPARSAWARWRCRSCPRSWGSRCRSGRITVTECEMVNQFKGSEHAPPQFTRGYGLAFGHSERKAMAMALVDRALRAKELGEEATHAGAGPGVRAVARGQRAGDGLRRAPEAAALRGLPGRACPAAPAARRMGCQARGGPAGGGVGRGAARPAGRRPNDRRARLQLRLPRRADQAHDPPRAS